MTKSSPSWLPMLALILAMALWSSAFIALKNILAVWGPGQVIFARMLVASICFLLLFKYWRRIQYRAGDWRWLLLMSLAEPCIYFSLEANALTHTSAGQAGMVTATLPLMVSFTAFFMLGERISGRQLLGFLVAIVGVVWLTLAGDAQSSAPAPLLGNLLELGAMACASVYAVILKKLSSRYSPLFLTAIQAFTGVLFFGPWAWFEPIPLQLGWQELGYVLYLGACVTLGAYLLNNWAITQLPVTLAAAYSNLIPVFTLLLAYLLLGETMNGEQLLACGLVFVGVLLSQWRPAPMLSKALAVPS
jgi:drug/metabolite transporter (DMT)-like permease